MTPNADAIFKAKGGVSTNPPPALYLEQTQHLIADAVAKIGQDERGVLTWIATTEGVNLALVDKIGPHVEVTTWLGKNWGEPIEAGIAGRIHW